MAHCRFPLVIVILMTLTGVIAGCSPPGEGALEIAQTSMAPPTVTAETLEPFSTIVDTQQETDLPLTGDILRLASATSDGRPGLAYNAEVSDDGRYVVFATMPSVFPIDETGPFGDSPTTQVFLYDMAENTTEIVSSDLDGEPSNSDSFAPSISSSGETIAFVSSATNLTQADERSCLDSQSTCYSVYLYDSQSEILTRAVDVNSTYISLALSADGYAIAYAATTYPGQTQVYLFDRRQGTEVLISEGDNDETSFTSPIPIDLSADGSKVVFATYEHLTPDDTNDVADVYLYDVPSSQIERISRRVDSSDMDQPSGLRPQATSGTLDGLAISGDGRYVAFMSEAVLMDVELFPCDPTGAGTLTPTCRHIYLYDRETRTMELISVTDDGIPADGASQEVDISADGKYVIFTSWATNLVPDGREIVCDDFPDLQGKGCPQVYLRDRAASRTYLISRGSADSLPDGRSNKPRISPDGNYAIFLSGADNLVEGIRASIGTEYLYEADLDKLLRSFY